jgi:two-component system CheB/CheR fusion protein
VPACATGEEAYSLGMLLLEHPRVAQQRLKLQIFATDVDRHSLDIARKGHYPLAIEQTVSAERLRRFFHKSPHGYQVRKELREAVMFAPQNVVVDPPFSRMDLVSCRNLLIYMEPELQRRVLQTFHFALEADGILALGKSETIGTQTTLFATATPHARIYRRIGNGRTVTVELTSAATGVRHVVPSRTPVGPSRESDYGRIVREALLEHRIAAAVLADREGHALYFYGPVQAYLDQPEGAPTIDLFAILRDELRPQLRAAMHKAHHEQKVVESVAAMHAAGDVEQPVRMVVLPVGQPNGEGMLLITFERLERQRTAEQPASAAESAALRALEEDLRNTKRELRSAIEELESTNEELKVANEEAMSMNEELQSTNEELETSKEELQSVNEELTTVNHQLQEKVDELESVNNDLGNLLTSTSMPTLFLDRQLNIKRYTPAATRLFKLIPGDLNRPLSDIASDGDLPSLLEDARSVLEHLAPVERETRTARGEHYLRRTLPYRTQDERIDGIVVTFTDITAVKAAAESTRRFATVMKDSNDAIVVHELGGKVTAWNRGAEALYGLAESDVLGTAITALLPPEERQAYAQQIQRLIAGERQQGVESRRRRHDGSIIEVSATLSLLRDENEQPIAVALTERDITPRKRAEQALRDSEQRFRTLADSAPVLIWMSDSDGALDFVNREFAVFTGLPAHKLLGRRWTELLHEQDEERVSTALKSASRRVETTAQLRSGSGGSRWVKLIVMPRGIGDKPAGYIGSMIDIHAQMDAEQALRLANQRKDEFLAMLGHELRNPLVPIRNAAEVLNRVGGDDQRVRWVRDTLVRQVEHVTRLVDDLLDISLISRGTMRLHVEPVDLRQAAQHAIEATRGLMSRKRHHFESRIPEHPMWIEGDSIRLSQVFENLLINAAKYTDEGGEIRFDLSVVDGDAVVRVRDNGIGIQPAMRSRIFDLFVQDERSVDRSQGGLGIGLALVRHLVELHGGLIEATSDGVGTGCEFVVRLPLLPESSAPMPLEQPAESRVATGRVMVIDDDAAGAESLVVLLRLYGYDAQRAENLESALNLARRFRPQVVLMDLAMPGADGYEVARRLRALREMDKNAAYIALTGFGQPEDFRRTAGAGFSHHLVKPVDPADLDKLLRKTVRQAGP